MGLSTSIPAVAVQIKAASEHQAGLPPSVCRMHKGKEKSCPLGINPSDKTCENQSNSIPAHQNQAYEYVEYPVTSVTYQNEYNMDPSNMMVEVER
uniref:Uncharacterized protein n=1 Tax=Vombatus ursinus TaxID=29139 RepID=A0A4X2LY86_VOMUR